MILEPEKVIEECILPIFFKKLTHFKHIFENDI